MVKKPIEIEALKHDAAARRNIPTAEFESVMTDEDKRPIVKSLTEKGLGDFGGM